MQDKSSAKVLRGSSPERLGEWDPPHTLMEESHCTSPESPNVYKPCSRRPTLLTQTSHPPRLEIPPTKGAVPRGQCKPLISMQTQPGSALVHVLSPSAVGHSRDQQRCRVPVCLRTSAMVAANNQPLKGSTAFATLSSSRFLKQYSF